VAQYIRLACWAFCRSKKGASNGRPFFQPDMRVDFYIPPSNSTTIEIMLHASNTAPVFMAVCTRQYLQAAHFLNLSICSPRTLNSKAPFFCSRVQYLLTAILVNIPDSGCIPVTPKYLFDNVDFIEYVVYNVLRSNIRPFSRTMMATLCFGSVFIIIQITSCICSRASPASALLDPGKKLLSCRGKGTRGSP